MCYLARMSTRRLQPRQTGIVCAGDAAVQWKDVPCLFNSRVIQSFLMHGFFFFCLEEAELFKEQEVEYTVNVQPASF